MRETVDFGIDLGTTNSSIALYSRHGVEVFKNAASEVTPSVVWIDAKGNRHVGQSAYQRLEVDPANVHAEFKRLMGQQQRLPFRDARLQLSPEELSAEVLKLLRILPEVRGHEVDTAVITHPAAFLEPQRGATTRAAELAGLKYVELLQEPIAAAYAYGFREESKEGFLLVYDLGGGTLDIALMRAADGTLQVIDHAGDNNLGGKDLDWMIVRHFMFPALAKSYRFKDLKKGNDQYASLLQRLKMEAEAVKIELSLLPTKWIHLEDIGKDDAGKSVTLEVDIARSAYEDLIRPILAPTLDLCRALLLRNNLAPNQVSQLIPVGGPTFTPLLRKLLRELGIPIDFSVDPMTIVAQGAAIYARSIRVPEHLRAQPAKRGRLYVSLEYPTVSANAEPMVGGCLRQQGTDGPQPGLTVQFERLDGNYRSVSLPVEADGTFLTTVKIEPNKLNEFRVRVRDASQTELPVEPDTLTISGGLEVSRAPLSTSVRIALSDGGTLVLIHKGEPLPTQPFQERVATVKAIRRGDKNAQIRIPFVEGEEERADRNIGGPVIIIDASKIKRDLAEGAQIDLRASVDAQGKLVGVSAYVNNLDQFFEDFQQTVIEHDPVARQRARLAGEVARIDRLIKEGEGAGVADAVRRLKDLRSGTAMREIESQIEAAAGGDKDASGAVVSRLVALGKEVDRLEAEIEWPVLLQKHEAELADVRGVVSRHGRAGEKERLAALEQEAQDAIRRKDAKALKQRTREMLLLEIGLLETIPDFWVARFEWVSSQPTYTNPGKASKLKSEGQAAAGRRDVAALKRICGELVELLPADTPEQPGGKNTLGSGVRRVNT